MRLTDETRDVYSGPAERTMNREITVTELLAAWSAGNEVAQGQLMEIVYGELKQLARAYPTTRAAEPIGDGDDPRPRGLLEARRSAPRAMAQPKPLLRHRCAGDATNPRRSRPCAPERPSDRAMSCR